MTDYTELVKALRHCVSDEKGVTKCAGCPYYPDITSCMDRLHTDAAAAIEALQAQLPKRGEWIDNEFGAKCSYCGKYAYWSKFEIPWKSPYCPLCGAKMEVQDG